MRNGDIIIEDEDGVEYSDEKREENLKKIIAQATFYVMYVCSEGE